MFKNMSLKKKLMSGFVAVAVIAAVIGGVGAFNLKKLDDADTRMYEMMTVPLEQIAMTSTAFQRMRCDLLGMQFADSNEKINEIEKKIADREKEIAENIPKFEKTLLTEEGRKLNKDLKENLAKFEELEKKYDAQFKVVFDAIRELMRSPEPKKRPIGFLVEEPKVPYLTKRKRKR